MSTFKGLNSGDLEKIRGELRVQANDIYKAFKKIDSIMDEYKDCFIDDVSSVYKQKYAMISAQYYNIYENMVSISEEFTRLNYKYSEKDRSFTSSINNSSI